MEVPAPDTVRDQETVITVPLVASDPRVAVAGTASPASPAPATAPLAEPLKAGVGTEPLAIPAGARLEVTYDVYTPDDTLRAKQALQVDRAREVQRQRIGLAALGLSLTLVTSLAAFGSCEDRPAGLVETTAATVSAGPRASTPIAALPPVLALTVAPAPTVTPLEPMTAATTAIPISPPLAPVTTAPRRRAPRPTKR